MSSEQLFDDSVEEAQNIYYAAVNTVNRQNGEGYALKNPQLTAAVVELFKSVYLSKSQQK